MVTRVKISGCLWAAIVYCANEADKNKLIVMKHFAGKIRIKIKQILKVATILSNERA